MLVVDNDAAVLNVICKRLLAEGHDVSTARRVQGLSAIIARFRPDILLIDVLMPDLNGSALSALLQRCAAAGTPGVILHSSIPARALRSTLDTRNALGIVQKTKNDLEFFFSFNAILDRLAVRPSAVPVSLERTMSGTHRISPKPELLADEEITSKTSPGRR